MIRYALLVLAFTVVVVSQSLAGSPPALPFGTHSYPRVGNLFEGDVRTKYAETLSKWDIVGLTATAQESPEMLAAVRLANPEVALLAYFPAAIIWANCPAGSPLVASYLAKIQAEDWWLYDDLGNRIGRPGAFWYLNLTTKCTRDGSGQIFAEWLGHYIAGEIMGAGYWNGLILDGLDEDIRWLNSTPAFFHQFPAGVDCDRDGVADDPDSLYVWWKTGVEILLSTLRADAGASCVIVPNGNNYMYQYANGGIREDFPHMHGGWQENMFAPYGYMASCANFLDEPMNASMMLCYWREGARDILAPPDTPAFRQFARFTLTSALLGDGFYFLDAGAGGSLWWLDYYDLDLGAPVGAAYLDTLASSLDGVARTAWRREFTNASVYCNPTQDPIGLDDGTVLSPEDGAIKVHSLPGPLACSIVKSALHREFVQRQRSITVDVVVRNESSRAAMAYVWGDLIRDGETVASGVPAEHIVGARRADTLPVDLEFRLSPGLEAYCLRISVGGPDYVPTGQDTVWLAKPSEHGKKLDNHSPGVPDFGDSSLGIFPQPMFLSSAQPLTLEARGIASGDEPIPCRVKIYDANGRLVARTFDGDLREGQTVVIADPASGAAPKAPGVYFLRIETGNRIITRRIVILK